jgi:hypothetical protein
MTSGLGDLDPACDALGERAEQRPAPGQTLNPRRRSQMREMWAKSTEEITDSDPNSSELTTSRYITFMKPDFSARRHGGLAKGPIRGPRDPRPDYAPGA